MSGFELAGVILAAFPLLISGAQYWRKAQNVGENLRNTKEKTVSDISDMELEKIFYERNLRSLLTLVLEDEYEVYHLMKEPTGDWMSNLQLRGQLKAQLGERHFQQYLRIMSRMGNAVTMLHDELGLNSDAVQQGLGLLSVPTSTTMERIKSTFKYKKFQVTFSLKASTRASLIQELKHCNETLDRLIRMSGGLITEKASSEETSKVEEFVRAVEVVQDNSSLLHNALQTAWQCSCRQSHHINLQLEHRAVRKAVSFDTVLASNAVTGTPNAPSWSFQGMRCKRKQDCDLVQKHIFTQVIHPRREPTNLVVQVRSPSGEQQGLCHELSDICPGICLRIRSSQEPSTCLHPITMNNCPSENNMFTLDQVLSLHHIEDVDLDRKCRYKIALQIASSVLQLACTPWMHKSTSNKDFIFFASNDHQNANDTTNFGTPFLRTPAESILEQYNSKDIDFPFLGILLTELHYGQRVVDRKEFRDMPTDTFDAKVERIVRLHVAYQWAKKIVNDIGPVYASAVEWCFNPKLVPGTDWRTAMIKSVIIPLERSQISD